MLIHDWQDQNFYRRMNDADPRREWWEHLRRHPTYQRDWTENCDKKISDFAPMDGALVKYGLDLLINPESDNVPLNSETVSVSEVSFSKETPDIRHLSDAAERFIMETARRGDFLVRIDPRRDLESQFHAVRPEIAALREAFGFKVGVTRARAVGLHLQVLDAEVARAKAAQDGEMLGVDEIALTLINNGVRYDHRKYRQAVERAQRRCGLVTEVPWPSDH
jgi:hypothetical protein